MFDIRPEVIAIGIPILVVLGVFATVITAIVVGGKQKELEHKERLIAMEKGMPIPQPPEVKKRPAYRTIRVWGLIFTAIGIAVTLGITAEAGIRHGLWGLIPLLVGIALLFAGNLEKRESEQG
jgi:hypothetical protein